MYTTDDVNFSDGNSVISSPCQAFVAHNPHASSAGWKFLAYEQNLQRKHICLWVP
jgi:hypothetical protein